MGSYCQFGDLAFLLTHHIHSITAINSMINLTKGDQAGPVRGSSSFTFVPPRLRSSQLLVEPDAAAPLATFSFFDPQMP